MNKPPILLIASLAGALLLVGGLGGFGIKVLADGIPSPNPLYYSGTLTEGGNLVSGSRSLTVNLWPNPAPTVGETTLCNPTVATTTLISGRFRIALDSTCKTAINQNNNVWVEVQDGPTSLGRASIGAVPYAVEADHAVTATTAEGAASGLASTLSALQAQITTTMLGPRTPSAFHAWLTTSPSIPNDTGVPITFDHVEYDLGSEYSSSTGVFSPRNAGVYLVHCGFQYANTTAGIFNATIYKNGAEVALFVLTQGSTANSAAAETTSMVQLAAGDMVTCLTFQLTGAPVPLLGSTPDRNNFSAARLY